MIFSNFGSDARFVLYSITFENLDSDRQKDLKTITIESADGDDVIYKRGEGEDIPIGEPLPLIGPVRSYLPYGRISILFGDFLESQWRWKFDYRKQVKKRNIKKPITKVVYDPDSDSSAIICYGLVPKGVDAKLELQYVDHDKGRFLRITEGKIWATTAGDSGTTCVLHSFRVSKDVYPHEPIILDRSEIVVPSNSFLEVTVDLKYYFVSLERKEESTAEIRHTYTLHAPNKACSTSVEVPLIVGSVCAPELLLVVKWSDDLVSKHTAKLARALEKFAQLCSTVEVESERGQSSSKQPTRNVSDILASPKPISSPAALSSPFTPENLKSPFSVSFEPTTIAPDQYSASPKPNPLNQSYEPTEQVSDIETPIDTGDSINQAVVGNEMGEGELIHNGMMGDVILEWKRLGRDEVSPPLGQQMPKRQRLEECSDD